MLSLRLRYVKECSVQIPEEVVSRARFVAITTSGLWMHLIHVGPMLGPERLYLGFARHFYNRSIELISKLLSNKHFKITYCASCHISLGSSAILLSLRSRWVKECSVHNWGGSVASAFCRNRNTRTVNAPEACWANAGPREARPPPLKSRTFGGCVLCVPWNKNKIIGE